MADDPSSSTTASFNERALWRAYAATRFTVFGDDETIVLRHGEKSAELDARLEADGVPGPWAFITAWNPDSVELSQSENDLRNRTLRAELEAAGHAFHPGEGVGEDPAWEPEQSLLVAQLTRAEAIELGRRWDQKAVLVGRTGGPATLVDCSSGEDYSAYAEAPRQRMITVRAEIAGGPGLSSQSTVGVFREGDPIVVEQTTGEAAEFVDTVRVSDSGPLWRIAGRVLAGLDEDWALPAECSRVHVTGLAGWQADLAALCWQRWEEKEINPGGALVNLPEPWLEAAARSGDLFREPETRGLNRFVIEHGVDGLAGAIAEAGLASSDDPIGTVLKRFGDDTEA